MTTTGGGGGVAVVIVVVRVIVMKRRTKRKYERSEGKRRKEGRWEEKRADAMHSLVHILIIPDDD